VSALAVDDDPLMAMDLEDTLAEAGAVVVGLCQNVNQAAARVKLGDFAVWSSISALGRALLRRSRAASPIVQKPASPARWCRPLEPFRRAGSCRNERKR